MKILAKIHKFNFTKYPTEQETEEAAKVCEEYMEIFPVLFPKQNLTRKQYIISMIYPIFIRKEPLGAMNKFLTLEECGESLHKQLNILERKYTPTRDKGERYLTMKKDYMNSIKVKDSDWYNDFMM